MGSNHLMVLTWIAAGLFGLWVPLPEGRERSDAPVRADDLLAVVQRRPFEPFRIKVYDGSFHDVYHPEMVMVGATSVTVGVPAAGRDRLVYQSIKTIHLRDIDELLPLPLPPPQD